MEPFRTVRSVATPLDKINVDTDQIVPKQFLKLVQRSGFGKYLFYDWRYESVEGGSGGASVVPRPDFVLNHPRYKGSAILVTGENFGCGSSREHAVWALADYGFRAVIAPSFADIFYNNCFKNGVLPVTLERGEVRDMLKFGGDIEVDLKAGEVRMYSPGSTAGPSHVARFEIEPHRRTVLLEGLDEIAQTLKYEKKISEFERKSGLAESAIPSLPPDKPLRA